jgi:hypothetical protein
MVMCVCVCVCVWVCSGVGSVQMQVEELRHWSLGCAVSEWINERNLSEGGSKKTRGRFRPRLSPELIVP